MLCRWHVLQSIGTILTYSSDACGIHSIFCLSHRSSKDIRDWASGIPSLLAGGALAENRPGATLRFLCEKSSARASSARIFHTKKPDDFHHPACFLRRERDWASGIPYALAAGLLKIKESEAKPPFLCCTFTCEQAHSEVCTQKNREIFISRFLGLAEREGFEPPNPFRSTVFKTAAFDHSAISPIPFWDCKSRNNSQFCKKYFTIFQKRISSGISASKRHLL